jgi:transcriptional regulator of acetoin/glycerol metabolism
VCSENEKRNKTLLAWKSFINDEPIEEGSVRDIVLESWKRSKAYGVDPFSTTCEILSDSEIEKRISRRKDLVETAKHYLEKIYEFVEDTSFYVALTDEDGYILSIIGNATIVSMASKTTSAVLGSCRNERAVGTNGMGLCLALNQPVQTVCGEHYMESHHRWACSVAPIRNNKGEIIGTLDFTASYTDVHSHSLGMVVAAVDGIEKEMELRRMYREAELSNQLLTETIESLSSSIVVIDVDGKIKHINNAAKTVLGIGDKADPAADIRINDYLDISEYIEYITLSGKSIANVEMSVNVNGNPYDCTMSVSIVSKPNDEIDLLVITLKDMESVHKLVNKLTGSKATFTFDSIIGQSESVGMAIGMAKIAARTNSNVLLLGESGTGKELFAQAIHNKSSRRKFPFIAINCGALPRGLIESELFGYESGAFTGAKKEGLPGKFELANGGTVFLDEIADMPYDVQASLLRVLQNKEVTRLGGEKSKKVDVRIIAATNKDLEECVHQKTFREDLYFRLNVFPISIPSLKERMEDIDLLVHYFISQNKISLEKKIVGIDEAAMACLKNYPWPGNIRELENIIERALTLCPGPSIGKGDLPAYIVKDADEDAAQNILNMPYPKKSIGDMEKNMIIQALKANRGNIKKSADSLGINRRTLYNKLEKLNISSDKYRETETAGRHSRP